MSVDLNQTAELAYQNTEKLKQSFVDLSVRVFQTFEGSHPNWIAVSAVVIESRWLTLIRVRERVEGLELPLPVGVGVVIEYSPEVRVEHPEVEELSHTSMMINREQPIEILKRDGEASNG